YAYPSLTFTTHMYLCFLFYSYADPRHLHSFPTRRSSDLIRARRSSFQARRSICQTPSATRMARAIAVAIVRPIGNRGLESVIPRSEEHTSELQSRENLVCRLLLEKKKKKK